MSAVTLDSGVLRLTGELDHATAGALRRQAGQLLHSARAVQITVDCAGVTRANSAGLALLLAILRDAAALGKELSIHHLPADMQQMARVCELADILQLAS